MPTDPQFRFHYADIATGETYQPDRFHYTAPNTGNLLLVERDEAFVQRKIGSGRTAQRFFDELRYGPQLRNYPENSGVWQWRHLNLPGFPERAIISLNEGQSDMFQIPRWLAAKLGFDNLLIKMEGSSPSGSFKDRGMSVAVSDALRLQQDFPTLGIKGVACASTGDTSAAAAIYSAYERPHLACVVFVPNDKITMSQLFQAIAHGATVVAIDHPLGFDGCMTLIKEFSTKHPEYVLVNSMNAMRIVGQETIGLEIVQDCQWNVPDWISIPVGNGGNLTALMIAMLRAKSFGLIDRLPGIIVGQTKSADTIVRWSDSGFSHYAPGIFTPTVASAMNINDSVSFPRIQKLRDQFDIRFYAIEEKEITRTWFTFTQAGAMICPQSAVALAATIRAREELVIRQQDTVVAISTANGVKFAESGVAYHNEAKVPGDGRNPIKVVPGILAAIEAELK